MIKKFLIGTFVAFVLLVGVTASAAFDFGPTTLKVGSSGQYVMNLQTALGVTADGAFGPMTKAKVMAFQASKGLTADGVVGPATKNALNAGTFSDGTNLPAGCTTATGFSSTTGQSCSVVTTLPAGCTSTAGFSSTTGAKCDGGTTVGTDNGPLVGGAGDIEMSTTSTDVEDTIVEGQSEKVLGFKVEAQDSDVAIKNLKLTLENNGTGSYRLSDYADTVEVYMGTTKVASVNTSDFTKKSASDTSCDSDICYTKSVTLDNAIVREGSNKKATFYVVIEANSNLDSDDVDVNNWNVMVSDARFQDATGVIMTSTGTANNDVVFTDLAGSGDVTLKVTKASTSPDAQNVEVSDTGSTSDVAMLEFKMKAEGTDMSFDTLDVLLSVPDAQSVEDMLGELVLMNGSDELASISSFTDQAADVNTTDDTYLVSFDLDDTFTIDADATETFKVTAKINDIDNFSQGDSLKVSFDDSYVTMEDENGDEVTSTSGTANGEYQTFFSEGVTMSAFSSTVTAAVDAGLTVKETYKITFKVTAMGNDYYVNKAGLVYSVETDGGVAPGAGDVLDSASALSSTADLTTGYYLVAEGDTETFTLTVSLTSGTAGGFYHVQLDTLNYAEDATGTNDVDAAFNPASDYETADAEVDAA